MAIPSGWNPTQDGKYKTTQFLPGVSGIKKQVSVTTSAVTGNFVVSDINGNPIYSYDANGGISISNAQAYKQLFAGVDGNARLDSLNKSMKSDTVDIAREVFPNNAEAILQTPQYRSQSNTDSFYQPPNPPTNSGSQDTGNDNNNNNGFIKGVTGVATPGANNGRGLVYPIDRNPRQDFIMFTSVDRCNNQFERCSLPIQGGIADNNAVDFAGGKLNPLQEGAAGVIGGIIGGEDISKQIDTAKDKVAKDEGGIKKFIESAATAAALGVSQDELLSRFKGAVVNPNLQLLFKGPTLRPFSFTFTLSPRSAGEATIVRRIVRFFKFNMAIQKTSGQLFLAEPRTFQIQYVNGDNPGEDHRGLNRIKRCALQACNVEYTPAGTYSRFNDDAGTMTQYKIGLQFQEIEPIYSEDYENHDIGF